MNFINLRVCLTLKIKKKFCQFKKASIHLKSDVQHSELPSTMKYGDQIASSPDEIETLFKVFFNSESESLMLTKQLENFLNNFNY